MYRWQQRVVDEKERLSADLARLVAFMASSKAKKLPTLDKNLLMAQSIAMQQYEDILKRRIDCFEK